MHVQKFHWCPIIYKLSLAIAFVVAASILSGCASMHEKRDERVSNFIELTEAIPLQSWEAETACSQALVEGHRLQFSVSEDTPRYSLPNGVDATAVCFHLPQRASQVELRTLARGGMTYHSVYTLYPSVMFLDHTGSVIRDEMMPKMHYRERMASSGLTGAVSVDRLDSHWMVLYFRPEYFADQIRFRKSGISAGATGSGVFLMPYDLGFDIPVSPFGAMDVRVSVARSDERARSMGRSR